MPRNSRQILAEAENQFPVRIVIKTPPDGFGRRYAAMMAWLDENCGLKGWQMTPAGTRGVANDALAVFMSNPTCAVAFVARWCVPGNDPPGCYEMRPNDPAQRVSAPHHRTPSTKP